MLQTLFLQKMQFDWLQVLFLPKDCRHFISSLLLPIEIIDSENNEVINNENLQLCVGQDKTIGPEPVFRK